MRYKLNGPKENQINLELCQHSDNKITYRSTVIIQILFVFYKKSSPHILFYKMRSITHQASLQKVAPPEIRFLLIQNRIQI
jgi:hypothetical protein